MKTKSFISFVVMAMGLLFGANSSAQTYCSPTFSSGCAFGDYLDDVAIGSFTDLSTGCSTGSVYDGTSDTIQVNIGDPVSLSLTSGYASHFYGIWIDYNNNGNFDSTEFVWHSSVKSGAAGTATAGSFTVPVSVSTGVYRLRVIAKWNNSIPVSAVDGCGSFTYGESHDYSIKINSASTCPAPSNIAYSTTDTSAALSWSFAGSSVTNYTVNYGPSGFTQGTGSFVTVSTDSAFITNLNGNTEYDFYVIANCNSTESSMANAVIGVKTQCPAYFSTPYFEDFESSPSGTTSNPTLPDCWTSYKSPSASTYSVYTYVYGYSFYSYSGDQSLNFSKGSGSGDTVMAILPPILGLDSATKMLEFYGRLSSTTSDGKVFICALNAQADMSSLKVLDSLTISSAAYEKYTLYLDASVGISSGDDRIAFMSFSNGSFGYRYIDDIKIKDAPPCPSPVAITLDNAFDTSIDISWSSPSSTFDIEYGPEGFSQGTGSTIIQNVNSLSASLSGLKKNTYYDVYVRSNCSSSNKGYSAWEGPVTVRTACSPLSVPYFENFDNGLSGNSYSDPALPDCWGHYNSGSGVYGYNSYSTAYSNSGTNSLYLYGSSSSFYSDTLLISTPEVAGLDSNNKEIVFKASTSNTGSTSFPELYVGTIDASMSSQSLSIVDTINLIYDAVVAGSYQEFSVELGNVPTGNSKVVFMVLNNQSLQYVNIDDVSIYKFNPCKRPANFTVNGLFSTTVNLDWEAVNSSTFDLKYGQEGFYVDSSGVEVNGLSSTSYTISGLEPNTTYDVYLRGDCSAAALGYSNWVGPVTITTQCSDYSGALVEGFESSSGSYNDRTPPTCWTYKEKSTGAYGYIYTYGNSNQGANSYRLYASASGSQDTALLASPSLGDLSSKSVEFEFWLRPDFLSSYYRSVLHLVAIDSTNEFSSVQILDSIAIDSVFTGTQFQKFTYRFDSIQDASKIGFMLVSNGSGQGAYIDDISIRDFNPCLQPSPIAVQDIIDTSATFTLNSATTGDLKIVEYGTANFIQGTGVQLGTITTSNNLVTISGLLPDTEYQIRFKDSCTVYGTSYWVNPVSFKTSCSSSSFVFEDFESVDTSWVFGNLPDCWQPLYDTNTAGTQVRVSGAPGNYNSQVLYLYGGNTSQGVISPRISRSVGDNLKLLLKGRTAYGSGRLHYGMVPHSKYNSVIDTLGSFELTSSMSQQIAFIPDSVIGANDHLVLFNSGYNVMYVDDIEFGLVEDCDYVFETNLDSLGTHGLQWSWNETISESIQVEYGPHGFSEGTGLTVQSDTGSIALKGLWPNTKYDFYFSENCGNNIFGEPILKSIYTASDQEPCQVVFNLQDSYGDGWNGASYYYNAYVDTGIAFGGVLQLPSGDSAVIVENNPLLSAVDSIVIYQNSPGNYPAEVSFDVFDGNGDIVVSIASGVGFNSKVFNPGCAGSCSNSSIAVIPTSNSVSFTNSSDSVKYAIMEFGQELDSSDVLYSQITNVQMDSLQYSTVYQMLYAEPCDSTWNAWSIVYFETECDEIEATLASSSSVFNTTYCFDDSLYVEISTASDISKIELLQDEKVVESSDNNSIALTGLNPTNNGNYSLRISNRCDVQLIELGSIIVKDTISVTAPYMALNTCLDLSVDFNFIIGGPVDNQIMEHASSINYGYGVDSISIQSVSYTDSGYYKLTASNNCETKSDSILLSVIEGTSIVSLSPDKFICSDSTEQLFVSAIGNNLNYNWSVDGVSLPNSNSDTISVDSPADSVLYEVQVSGICSADTSELSIANGQVLIKQRVSSQITSVQPDIVTCEAVDTVLNFNAIGDQLTYTWIKDGSIVSSGSNILSLDSTEYSQSGNYSLAISGTCGVDTSNSVEVDIRKTTKYLSGMLDDELCIGDDLIQPISFEGHEVTVEFFKAGSSTAILPDTSATTGELIFGLKDVESADEGWYYALLNGSCGQVITDSIYVTVFENTTISTTYLNNLSVICENGTLNKAFAAEGHDLSYAWYKGSSYLNNDSTLSLSNAEVSDSGNYQLVLSGTCGVDSSQVLEVIVHPETQITSVFADTSICENGDLTVLPSVEGFDLTYSWRKSGVFVTNTASLSLTDVDDTDGGEYQLSIDGFCGTDSSDVFDVSVFANTMVTLSSGDTTTCIGSDVNLAIQDTGYLNTYQWFYKGNVIANATSSSYVLPSVSSSDTGAYSVEISGTCGSDTSVVLPVYVFTTTDVLSVSSNIDACVGDQVVMNVDAIAESISYSWMKDGQVLPGATADSLVLNNIQSAFAGNFTVEVSGICGTVISDSVQLSIHQSPNITTQPISDTLCQYTNTTLITGATGFGATYDWYYNGVLLDTGSTLQLDSIRYAQSGDYQAVVVGLCGVDSSATVNILVDAILPSVSVPSNAFDICAGDTLNINATSLLGKIINAEWYKDSALVSSAQSYTLTDSGMYYVRLTDPASGCIEQTPMIHVGVNPVPNPISISGEDTLYQNIPSWYWVSQESGVDYSWSIPTGVVTAGWFTDSVEIKFSGSGTHMVYVQAKNQFDCTTNLSQEVLVSGIGISEYGSFEYSVYPNPTKDLLTFRLEKSLDIEISGQIIDIKGAVVSVFSISPGSESQNLDVTSLPAGQYQIVLPELRIAASIVKTD